MLPNLVNKPMFKKDLLITSPNPFDGPAYSSPNHPGTWDSKSSCMCYRPTLKPIQSIFIYNRVIYRHMYVEVKLNHITLHYKSLQYTHYVTLITLHYINHITLHCIELRCIALHYIHTCSKYEQQHVQNMRHATVFVPMLLVLIPCNGPSTCCHL